MTTPDNVIQKADSAYLNLPKRSEAQARVELHGCGHYLCGTSRANCDCARELKRETALRKGGAEVVELINHVFAPTAGIK